MAEQTTFLELILPANNEYVDTWDQPMNENSQLIDAWADGINTEIVNARFGQPNLAAFLSVSLSESGALQPIPEIVNAHSSFTYGDETTAVPPVTFNLPQRLNQTDMDIFLARAGQASLVAGLGVFNGLTSMVLSGAVDINGHSAWMSGGGTTVTLLAGGSNPVIYMRIGGYLARIRVNQNVTITGSPAAGTLYIWAQYQPNGVVTVDGADTLSSPTLTNGAVTTDPSSTPANKVRIFQDLTTNFVTSNVQPGDVLTIPGTSLVAGQYQLRTVAPVAITPDTNNSLEIYGQFPTDGTPGDSELASLSYQINDPFAVTLGFDTALAPAAGKFYLGQATWSGASISAVQPICLKDYYVGAWIAVSAGSFTNIWQHNLFDDALQVIVQVSQSNTGSAGVETVPAGTVLSSAVSLTGTATGGNGTLAVANGTPDSAMRVVWTTTTVTVSNAISTVFYRDATGTVRTSGYMRVLVTKKRV